MHNIKTKSICLLLFAFCYCFAYSQDTITLNSAQKFQTIAGWGHGGGILGYTNGAFTMLDSNIANPVNYEILDYIIDELGLTGSRITEVGPRTDGTGTDDGNCDSIDWSKFDSSSLPVTEADYLLYFQNRIETNGFPCSYYSSTGYPTYATSLKPWVLNDPGERAQQIWGSAYFLKNTYGINTSFAVIYNEPSGAVTYNILADDIKALGPRFISHGLKTSSQYAEAISPQTDWGFITPVENDTALWRWVGRLSYHDYGTADPYRSYIYNFGITKGLTTAQTEMGNPTFDDLYNDLTLANTSYWEVGYSGSTTIVPASGLTSFTPSGTFFRLRQVLHYVRPGFVRTGAFTKDSLLHVLAFSDKKNETVIIDNTSSSVKAIHLSGLPADTYGISEAAAGATTFQELGLHTVDAGDTLDLNVNSGGVVTTIYPYSEQNNPPDIITWTANPGYLVLPSTTATISATANDAELHSLTYFWSVSSHPKGTDPVIASPNAASTSVSGLSKGGTYIFTIKVSDGVKTSSKKLYLISYNSAPPPVLGSVGFRFAAPYGLVFTNPGDTTHANIELPTSSATLQIGISDLANSDFTGRGTWSLVKQPAGANVSISATTYIYVSIRATVSGMTVPGEYVFQVNVTNPGHPDLIAQIKCTVHPASSPPVINAISASPSILTLPASSSQLKVKASDAGHDLLRYWWAVTSVPAGANPVFDHQGLAATAVSGLTQTGVYIFTVRCFDDIHMTTKNDTVTVYGCDKPTAGFAATNITAASAKLNWDTINFAVGYKIEYRKNGETTWSDKIIGSNTGFQKLSGLSASTTYQWRIETKCNNDPIIFSDYSVINNFTTSTSAFETTAGASTDNKFSGIKLFPDPTNNMLSVSFETASKTATMQVVNIAGQSLLQKNISSANGKYYEELDITKLSAGVYTLLLRLQDGYFHVSFVKK